MGKKICILSMQRVNNFGSLLQSYSLKKMIESLGNEVFFIDIERKEDDNALMKYEVDDYSAETGMSKNILSKFSKLDRYTLNRIKIKILSNKQIIKFQQFRENILEMKIEYNHHKYDTCVIGSDEVFNCNAASPWGFTSQLFGNVRQADNVITYAASCGSTKYENVLSSIKEKIIETFTRVKAFSVRDDNTYEFVASMTDKNVEHHLDPVLIGEFDDEIKDAKILNNLPENYCVVYSYYNRIHSFDEINAIKKFCQKNQLEIVSIGAPQMWIKKHLVADPFQMLKVFQKADFVITDTFHGTIFSAKYANKFAVLVRESNKNKLLDLIKRLQLEKHLVQTFDELQDIDSYIVDTEKVMQIIKYEREKSLQYLSDNL